LLWLSLGQALPARAIAPAQAATPQPCQELVVNGDFEEIGPGWNLLAGDYLPSYTTVQAYGGSRQSLLLGSLELPNARTVSVVEQVIALPAGIDSAILSFHYFPVYEEAPGAGDEQTVEVRDRASNEWLGQVLNSQLNLAEWRSSQYDLTPLAGREIRLIFGVRNDGQGGRIAMYIDGVSVRACGAARAPTTQPTPAAPPPVSAECDCHDDLFDCPAFSSWSAAQACYDRCRVLAGFDVHLLDEDADGVACELAPVSATVPGESPLTSTVPMTMDQTGGALAVHSAPEITATARAVTASIAATSPPEAALAVTGSVAHKRQCIAGTVDGTSARPPVTAVAHWCRRCRCLHFWDDPGVDCAVLSPPTRCTGTLHDLSGMTK
jgi:hypothetical protein